MYIHKCIHIYIYVYIYICMYYITKNMLGVHVPSITWSFPPIDGAIPRLLQLDKWCRNAFEW